MKRLDGVVAIVTGASSGNGRAIALRFAQEGAAVLCADLRPQPRPGGFDEEPDLATDELIRRRGGHSAFARTDVSQAADAEAMVHAAVDAFGRLDVLVNNAGIMPSELRTIVEDSESNYERIMGVNARGTWLCSKYALAQMAGQELVGRIRGRIINIASISGTVIAFPGAAQYAASKGAIRGLTMALAAEWAPHKITVNAIAPSFFRTAIAGAYADEAIVEAMAALVPLGEIGRPEDLSGVAAFLASRDADYLTGLVIPLDGGFTIAGPLPH